MGTSRGRRDGHRLRYLAARDATAPGAAASKFGALCAAPALRGLGACSFEVYLFQWPVHASFAGLGLNTSAGGEVFVAYALVLYVRRAK